MHSVHAHTVRSRVEDAHRGTCCHRRPTEIHGKKLRAQETTDVARQREERRRLTARRNMILAKDRQGGCRKRGSTRNSVRTHVSDRKLVLQ